MELTHHHQSGSQAVDDGSVLQVLDILFGFVEACCGFCFGRSALYQLDKVVAVNFVHDAEHTAAVVADPLQVLAFAGVGLGCEWRGNALFMSRNRNLQEEQIAIVLKSI